MRAGKGAATVASKRRADVWKLRATLAADGPLVRARAPAERILEAMVNENGVRGSCRVVPFLRCLEKLEKSVDSLRHTHETIELLFSPQTAN